MVAEASGAGDSGFGVLSWLSLVLTRVWAQQNWD